MAFHPTQPWIAAAGQDRVITLHSLQDGTLLDTLEHGHARSIRSLVWTKDGKHILSAGFDGKVCIWSRQPPENLWEVIATLEGHENEVKCVALNSRDVFVATCGRDKSVWVWEWMNHTQAMQEEEAEDEIEMECVGVMQDHTGDVKSVTWHPNQDLLLSCSYDETIRVWEEDTEEEFSCRQVIEANMGTIWECAWNKQGDGWVAVGEDGSIRFWKRRKPDPMEMDEDDNQHQLPANGKMHLFSTCFPA